MNGEIKNINDVPTIQIPKSKMVVGIAILYCLFALDVAARFGVLSVFPSMQADLGLNDSQLGLIGAITAFGMSVFVLPFSFLADKVSKKFTIGIMGTLWGMGCLACAFATNFILIVAGRFLIGLGVSSYAPVSVSIFTSWVRQSKWGTAIGIYNSSMPIGMALGTAVAGALAAMYDWRVPFIVIGCLTFVFIAFAMFLPKTELHDKKQISQDNAEENKKVAIKENVTIREAAKVTFKNRSLVLLSLAAGISFFSMSTMITWTPTYLVRTYGWDIAEVGSILGFVYLLMGLVAIPLGGVLLDLCSKKYRPMRVLFSVPAFILMAIMIVIGVKYNLFILILAYLFISNIPVIGFHTATQELVPARYKASAYGVYVIFLNGLGFLGPLVTGFLSDKFGLNTALIYIQIFYIIAAIFSILSGLSYMKDYNNARELEAI